MASDHWNFLANLLGAPGSADPPKRDKPAKSEEASDRGKAEAKGKVVEPDPADVDAVEGVPAGASPEAEARVTEPESDDVLEALQSVTPAPELPGFGSTDYQPVDQAPPEPAQVQPEFDQVWGQLADDLGVDASEMPPRPEVTSNKSDSEPSRGVARRERSDERHSPPKRRGGGFGNGLGVDLGPEPEIEEADSEGADEPAAATDFGPSKPTRDRDRSSGQSEREARSGRTRRVVADREDDEEPRGESTRRRVSRDRNDDESEVQPSRRRRQGRRGVRQRISDEPDQGESRGNAKADEDEPSPRPARSRRPAVESPRRDRERDTSDVSDDDADEFGGFAEGLVDVDEIHSDNDDQGDDELRRPRSRRRGRRGGRRGGADRSGTANASDADPDDDERGSRTRDRADDAEPDPLAQESAFDDDHEDDEEVEVIRRGRRRRSRSRGGRGPADGERSAPATEADDDAESGAGRRSREARSVDDDQDSPKKRNVPTWLETVSLLVESNIENHKRSSSSSRGGNRGRGGRRR